MEGAGVYIYWYNDLCMYVGSTKDIKTRKIHHKSSRSNPKDKAYNYEIYKAWRTVEYEDWEIEFIAFPEYDNKELEIEEQNLMDVYKPKYIGHNAIKDPNYKKQWCHANKDKIQKINKKWRKNNPKFDAEYRELNKERIKARYNEKITCDICGSIVARGRIARHKKSKKCLSFKK